MGKKKKKKFTSIWANQTALGKHFGLSAVAMGKKLKEFGLRTEDGKGSENAIAQGFCQFTPLADGTPFYMWNRQKIGELMEANGYQRLDPQEVRAQDIAKQLISISNRYKRAVSGLDEEMCFEEARIIKEKAKRNGLAERVNEILRDRKFDGDLIE